MEVIQNFTLVSSEIGSTIHEIQTERELSSGYLRSNGQFFKEELITQ